MQSELTKKSGLNKWWLQIIAIVAMLADHAAVLSPVASVYYILKLIGRITIVIMCYFIAEGYHKTSSIPKYIMRMGIFAAISQIPYYLYMYHGRIPTNTNGLLMSLFTYRNVIFTLFIGLVLLAIVKSGYNLFIKLVSCVAALYLVRSSDWGYYVILWVIGCGLFYGSKKKQLIWMSAIIALRIAFMAVDTMVLIAFQIVDSAACKVLFLDKNSVSLAIKSAILLIACAANVFTIVITGSMTAPSFAIESVIF